MIPRRQIFSEREFGWCALKEVCGLLTFSIAALAGYERLDLFFSHPPALTKEKSRCDCHNRIPRVLTQLISVEVRGIGHAAHLPAGPVVTAYQTPFSVVFGAVRLIAKTITTMRFTRVLRSRPTGQVTISSPPGLFASGILNLGICALVVTRWL